MRKKTFLALLGGLSFFIIAATVFVLITGDNAVLNPKGEIAQKQFDLIVFATALSLLVILPVFALTIYVSIKYRASKKPVDYQPDWDHSKKAETMWWGIPIFIIIILSVVTWKSTHELDPFRPIQSTKEPLEIQVVSLQWKWLFIYPEYNIASVNYAQIPVDRPVKFVLTSDAPMNSFWIPQLGGMIYTMTGMSTQLHLIANETGTYNGVSSNISGPGFADMRFTVDSTAESEFYDWTQTSKPTLAQLDTTTYNELRKPSIPPNPTLFYLKEEDLYWKIMERYTHSSHKYHHGSNIKNESSSESSEHSGGHH